MNIIPESISDQHNFINQKKIQWKMKKHSVLTHKRHNVPL